MRNVLYLYYKFQIHVIVSSGEGLWIPAFLVRPKNATKAICFKQSLDEGFFCHWYVPIITIRSAAEIVVFKLLIIRNLLNLTGS